MAGGILTAAITTGAQAQQPGQLAGGDITHAGVAPHERSIGLGTNPATPSLSERRVRFGILSNISAGYEFGDADDFDRDVEQLSDDFDALEIEMRNLPSDIETEDDADAVRDFINSVVNFEGNANDLVNDLTDSAYGKVTASITGPGAPLSVRSQALNGVVTVDYGGYFEGRVAVESSGDAFNTGLAGLDPDDVDQNTSYELIEENEDGYAEAIIDGESYVLRPSDDAGLAVQGGIVQRFSTGYAREVWHNRDGSLHAGATVSGYRVTLARSGVLLDDSDDVEDRAEDEFEDNQTTNTGFGIDVGVTWVADNFSLGATARNLNAPSFEYPDPCDSDEASQSCLFFEANPQAARNGSSWTMERQLTLEGSVYTQSRRWILAARLDANAVADTTGDDYQWAAVSATYIPDSFWIPSPRAGIRTNVAGEELTYISGGATFFRFLHLDVAGTLEETSVDNSTGPRSMQASLGMDLQF